MELLSIVTARAIFLFEVDALDPFGKISYPDIAAMMNERYKFANPPPPTGDSKDGLAFSYGRLGDIVIDKLTLFPNGIVVDTRSSTENSAAVIEDILSHARHELASKMVVGRKHFVSQITFRSAMNLAARNPVLEEIAADIRSHLKESLKQDFLVETTGFTMYADPTQASVSPAKFSIERRADVPFSENIYFASAPLPTAIHLPMVAKFEASLL